MKWRTACLALGLAVSITCARADDKSLTESLRRFADVKSSILTESRQTSPDVQQKVNAVPTLPVPQAGTPSQNAPADKQNALISTLNDYYGQWKAEQTKFSFWASFSIISTALLALISGIVSFAQKNKVAGVISLIVTAVVAISNAYPLGALSDFYRGLATKAASLQLECKLADPLTVDGLNSIATQLQVLIISEGKDRPSLGQYKAPDEQDAQQLTQIRSSAAAVEKARAPGSVVASPH